MLGGHCWTTNASIGLAGWLLLRYGVRAAVSRLLHLSPFPRKHPPI